MLLGLAVAGPARAENISGTISATKFITEDSQLVGNVTCTTTTEPCIDLAASHITLRLNGFTMTGPADPDAGVCNPSSGLPQADGIRTLNVTHVRIVGPGMIQKFQRHGIFIVGQPDIRTRATVSDVTSHHNCFSGVFANTLSWSLIEGVVSVRNSIQSGAAPCGGNCLLNSHNNVIRRNFFAGNGSAANNNNDFGVGLLGNSSGNLIEDNSIGGNGNGVLLQPNTSGNMIRLNVIAGNPPSQFSKDYGASIGADVKDEATTNGARNTFDRNWCVTYLGPGPAPCSNLPRLDPSFVAPLPEP
ncbi:MAG: right-handed parallel beta-helix repeat-containing protein [Vicinamibacterales bacterium]